MSFKPSSTMLYWGYGYSIFLFVAITIMAFTAYFVTTDNMLKIAIYTTCLVFSIFLFFYITGIYTDKDIKNLDKQDKDNG